MMAKDWMKDVLVIGVALAIVSAIAVYLTAKNRITPPLSFAPKSAMQLSVEQSAQQLDLAIEANLKRLGLPKSAPAEQSNVARRLALSLTGTLPSLEELRALEAVSPRHRVSWYVSHLLEDRRSSEYLAERFARAFVGVEEGPFLVYRRRRFVAWLTEEIHNNVRYDQLVQEILTDDGLWTDSPAVNFYTYNIIPDVDQDTKPDPIRLAGRTSRAFLGMRIDCLQCHDDFLGSINLGSAHDLEGGTQLHFHALASHFSQVENSVVGITDDLKASTYSHQLLDADRVRAIAAEVPFNQHLVASDQQNLRRRLAKWITHRENTPFARALVNRVWAMMMGQGFFQPIDDIPLDGPFPEAFEFLVNDFVKHDFDLQRLTRVIASSRAFARKSTANFTINDEHVQHFAVYPLVRLRPEQVAGAIIQSTSLKTIDSTSHIISRLMKFGQENDFVNRYGDLGQDEFTKSDETIAQRLLLLNGDLIKERIENGLNSPARIAGLSPDGKTAVTTIYLSTLARKPSAEEQKHFADEIDGLEGERRQQRIEDLYWTLINSIEFAWNY